MAYSFLSTNRINFPAINYGATVSVYCWARNPGTGFDALYGIGTVFAFEFDGSNVLTLETDDGGWTADMTGVDVTLWHHYAVTFDGNSTANDPVFYIDGILRTTTEFNPPETTWTSGSVTTDIGNFPSGSGPMEGWIAEAGGHDVILDQQEIHSAMCQGRVNRGLRFYCPLYGRAGTLTEVNEVTGGSGTFTGTPSRGEHSPNYMANTQWPMHDNLNDATPFAISSRRPMPMFYGPGEDFILGIQEGLRGTMNRVISRDPGVELSLFYNPVVIAEDILILVDAATLTLDAFGTEALQLPTTPGELILSGADPSHLMAVPETAGTLTLSALANSLTVAPVPVAELILAAASGGAQQIVTQVAPSGLLTMDAGTVTIEADTVIQVPAAALITLNAGTHIVSASVPGAAGTITLSGADPTLRESVESASALLTLSGANPALAESTTVPTATITLSAPDQQPQITISAPPASLGLSAADPSVLVGDVTVTSDSGTITLQVPTPTIISDQADLERNWMWLLTRKRRKW